MKTLTRFICLFGLAVLAACHSERRGEPITGMVSLANDKLKRGRLVFMKQCHQCHPTGEGGLGPALNDKPAPRFLLKTQVRTGIGTMPAFGKEKISPEELDALVDYILALRRADRPASVH
jgi:mono/diheme cytochrome c family protein